VNDESDDTGDKHRINQAEVHRQSSIGTHTVREQRLDRLRHARLYAITPDAEPDWVEGLVAAWLRAGVRLIQLRHKSLARGRLLELGTRLAGACAAAGGLFIVNDHVDIAVLCGADGAHLGQDDLSLAAARRVAGPDLLLGASASTPEAGREAAANGADYLGCGPAFATPIKSEKPVAGPGGVAAVAAAVPIPVFAIGGIERSRLPELRAVGVERVCSIRALATAADPEAEARAWLQALGPCS
jgi:thiamine-phosphate pyrophosphorylase